MNLIKHCVDQCWEVLQQVSDPEIPVLSVLVLGMIRGVELNQHDEIIVRLTPPTVVVLRQTCLRMKLPKP